MIELKPSNKSVNVEYTLGDAFSFTLKFKEKLKEDVKVILEVSPGGGKPLITKEYIPNGDSVNILLAEEDVKKLQVARSHMYRIMLVSEDKKASIVSGNIKLKWGV